MIKGAKYCQSIFTTIERTLCSCVEDWLAGADHNPLKAVPVEFFVAGDYQDPDAEDGVFEFTIPVSRLIDPDEYVELWADIYLIICGELGITEVAAEHAIEMLNLERVLEDKIANDNESEVFFL